MIKALQSKQGVENGPLVFLLWPHNAVLVPAVKEHIQGLQNGTVFQPTEIRQKRFTFFVNNAFLISSTLYFRLFKTSCKVLLVQIYAAFSTR